MALSFSTRIHAQQAIRLNCGGAAYTDLEGQVWKADTGYNWGNVSTIPAVVSGTPDLPLYHNGRYNPNFSAGMVYTLAVPNGQYHVNLYFAETYTATQVKGADVTVTNGQVTIEFDNLVQTAKVNAIEILPGTSGPSLVLNFKYPDGTPVSGNLAYTVSSSLLSFQGSAPLNNGQAQCVIFANPSAMGISAQFEVNLSLTDTTGHLIWQFSVGMNPAQVNIGSVQSSALDVVVQKL
jgi:hypothetical protein